MLSISKTTKGTPVGVPFNTLKKQVLGDNYSLSLVFIGDKRSKTLNLRYRGKDQPANVLTFPLDKKEGEILINPNKATRDAKQFGLSKSAMIALLFIHGMLHLKGTAHGRTMEKIERKILDSVYTQTT